MIAGSETATTELRRHGWLLLACMIGFGLGLSGIPILHPRCASSIRCTKHSAGASAPCEAGLMVSYLTSMLVLPAAGPLADRFGVRKVALFSSPLHTVSRSWRWARSVAVCGPTI